MHLDTSSRLHSKQLPKIKKQMRLVFLYCSWYMKYCTMCICKAYCRWGQILLREGLCKYIWLQWLRFGAHLLTERQKEQGVPYHTDRAVKMHSIHSLWLHCCKWVSKGTLTLRAGKEVLLIQSPPTFLSTFNTNFLEISFLFPPICVSIPSFWMLKALDFSQKVIISFMSK